MRSNQLLNTVSWESEADPAVVPGVDSAPVVIVGSGPAGIRVAQELHRLRPELGIIVYGEEPWDPYSRVRLSSFMAAQIGREALLRDQSLAAGIERRIGNRIMTIDAHTRQVIDARGNAQSYSALVLATGSRPFIPDIPGVRLPGVYTFRDLSDADRLLARQASSHRTVVLGGGLLGLEAARGMQRFNANVCIVELADRLLPRQLDAGAGEQLQAHVEATGIEVVLGDAIARIVGEDTVNAVLLKSGRTLACDTVIVATGIRPTTDLAASAGLRLGHGILVDAHMRTSDPYIYAAGECAQHAERRARRSSAPRIYGAAAPSLEQAQVVARVIASENMRYAGGPVAMRLKMMDVPVFSMGRVLPETLVGARPSVYRDREAGIYRKISTYKGRLVGAICIGEWSDLARVQGGITAGLKLWPWQLWRFRRTGSLWPETADAPVSQWPAGVAVCNCTGITRGQLGAAISDGHGTVAQLAERTGASTVCGSCRPLLAELLGAGALEPVTAYRALLGVSLTAMMLAVLLALPATIPYPDTLDLAWQWDQLWRSSLLKQITGFSVLVPMVLGLVLLVVKKRLRVGARADYGAWRWAHILLSASAAVALLIHTGGRLGNALDMWLIVCVLGLTLAGGALSLVTALEHRLPARLALKLRTRSTWLHVLLFWPFPLLLFFHVLKGYYY